AAPRARARPSAEEQQEWRPPSRGATVGLSKPERSLEKEDANGSIYRNRRARAKLHAGGDRTVGEAAQAGGGRDERPGARAVDADDRGAEARVSGGGNAERMALRNSGAARRRARGGAANEERGPEGRRPRRVEAGRRPATGSGRAADLQDRGKAGRAEG